MIKYNAIQMAITKYNFLKDFQNKTFQICSSFLTLIRQEKKTDLRETWWWREKRKEEKSNSYFESFFRQVNFIN